MSNPNMNEILDALALFRTNLGIDMYDEDEALDADPPLSSRVDFNFRPIKIIVYRNGDDLDPGTVVMVTRREFKHWIVFLDGLTRRLKATTAVHWVMDTNGVRIENFDDLQNGGEYVAIQKLPFIPCFYGSRRVVPNSARAFTIQWNLPEGKQSFLEGAESLDIYMKHHGYGSITGLAYPFDSMFMKSPRSVSLLAEHYRGDDEKLNDYVAPNLASEVTESLERQERDGLDMNRRGNRNEETSDALEAATEERMREEMRRDVRGVPDHAGKRNQEPGTLDGLETASEIGEAKNQDNFLKKKKQGLDTGVKSREDFSGTRKENDTEENEITLQENKELERDLESKKEESEADESMKESQQGIDVDDSIDEEEQQESEKSDQQTITNEKGRELGTEVSVRDVAEDKKDCALEGSKKEFGLSDEKKEQESRVAKRERDSQQKNRASRKAGPELGDDIDLESSPLSTNPDSENLPTVVVTQVPTRESTFREESGKGDASQKRSGVRAVRGRVRGTSIPRLAQSPSTQKTERPGQTLLPVLRREVHRREGKEGIPVSRSSVTLKDEKRGSPVSRRNVNRRDGESGSEEREKGGKENVREVRVRKDHREVRESRGGREAEDNAEKTGRGEIRGSIKYNVAGRINAAKKKDESEKLVLPTITKKAEPSSENTTKNENFLNQTPRNLVDVTGGWGGSERHIETIGDDDIDPAFLPLINTPLLRTITLPHKLNEQAVYYARRYEMIHQFRYPRNVYFDSLDYDPDFDLY